MNQVQTKFAIKRIYEIITAKCAVIEKEDAQAMAKANEGLNLSATQLVNKIKSGEINFLSKSKLKERGNISGDTSLKAVIDFSAIEKDTKNKLIKAGFKPHNYRHRSCQSQVVSFRNPASSQANDYRSYTEKTYRRLMKAKQALSNAADKIILGSEEEALKMIASIEKLKL